MLYFKVRNFEEFQHYRHRNPPWIRLYYRILHDRRFYRLDNASKWLAVGCFLLASQHDNKIPFDEEWIVRELSFEGRPNWQALLDNQVIIPIDCDASTLLATCKHHASQSITDSSEDTEAEILSISPKSAKSSLRESFVIFRCWNSQPSTMHHRSIGGQEKAIAKALRKYSPDEICRAIERYSCVRENKSGKYRDVYAWTLGEFLTRKDHYNIERFNAESWEDPFVSQDHRRADAGLPADDPGSDPIWDLVDGKAVMRLPR